MLAVSFGMRWGVRDAWRYPEHLDRHGEAFTDHVDLRPNEE